MNPSAILTHLQRTDKWYLGGGRRLVWTPPFPVWLDHLGFWDKANYYHLDLEPGFAITLLDEHRREISYRFEHRTWRPDGLTQQYSTSDGLALTERKSLHPEDVLLSALTLENTSDQERNLQLVLWTLQPSYPADGEHVVENVGYDAETLRFTRRTRYRYDGNAYTFGVALGMDRPVASFGGQLSQGRAMQPYWRFTPFYESIAVGTLEDSIHAPEADGLLYLGVLANITLPPGGSETVVCGLSAAPDSDEAARQVRGVLDQGDAGGAGTRHWERFFEQVPAFTCSDPFFETYYAYRWYGLRLFMLPGGEGNYRHPAVCEGLDYFRNPITYSAQCHILETRWMRDPAVAQGSLLNFIDAQKADGSFSGNLYLHGLHPESFYHANWAHIRRLHANHPDDAFLQQAYDGLARYADYFDRERDREGSGLYDILNHYETGQEYMHRYVAVEGRADEEHWGDVFRLKGVDVTVYLYEIKRCLAWIARRFGHGDEAARWDEGAEHTRRAVREEMWDPEAAMFFDIDPRTGERTGVKAGVCFYPYFTDLIDEAHLPGLKQHLLNPDEFWTPWPIPSSSLDDPYFDAFARWKGQRMNCPWNGRVWPMVNSHIAEALATCAIRFDDALLRGKATAFITRFIRMLFFDGDPARPGCFEHYNPMTSAPCLYRGVDDYQHSWVNELIIQYVCGIRTHESGVTVDPFPFDLDFRIDHVPVRGRRLGVERSGDRFVIRDDGREVASSRLGEPVELSV